MAASALRSPLFALATTTMILRIACRLLLMSLLCIVVAQRAAARDLVFRSPEFCFEAWFPEPPLEQDENRVTKQKIPIRARRFLVASEKNALLITAVKFDSAFVSERNLPDYFGSVIESYARKVHGKVERVSDTSFQGLPSKLFSLTWRDGGQDWRSENLILYDHGHTYTVTSALQQDAKMPGDARKFLQRLRVDRRCTSKSP